MARERDAVISIESVNFPTEFTTSVHVRWSDLDPNRHVNNAKVASLLEEARIAWHSGIEDAFSIPRFVRQVFVVNLNINYRAQLRYGTEILACVRTKSLGHSSFSLKLKLYQNERIAVEADCTQVLTDGNGRSARISGVDRDILTRLIEDSSHVSNTNPRHVSPVQRNDHSTREVGVKAEVLRSFSPAMALPVL